MGEVFFALAYLPNIITEDPAVTAATADAQNIISLVLTAVVSASVFGALISGVVQYVINKRNSRITERKNTVDTESELISRYKEAAAEERLQKESAVSTVKSVLAIAEKQVESLKTTVTVLNQTIELLKKTATAQQEVIDKLTDDRDRAQVDLLTAQREISQQRGQLNKLQTEILELTYPRHEINRLTKSLDDENQK